MRIVSRVLAPEPLAGRPRAIAILVVMALTAGLWLAAVRVDVGVATSPDGCDYAQMGRQILRGEGFTSRQTFPYVLGWMRAHGLPAAPPWPNVTRPPLPLAQQAIAFAVFGESDLAALLPSLALYVGTAVAAFLLGNAIAGPLAGALAAALGAASPTLLGYAVTNMTETGAAFFVLVVAVALVGLVGAPVGRQARWAAAAGLACGVAYLQRGNLGVLAIAVLAVIASQPELGAARHRARLAAVLAGAALLAASPWLLRNLGLAGDPLLSLTNDRGLVRGLTGGDLFAEFDVVEPRRLLWERRGLLLQRLAGLWILDGWRDLFGVDLRWAAPLAVASVLVPLAGPLRALRTYTLAALLATHVLLMTIFPLPRYCHPFGALLVTFDVALVAHVARRTLSRRAVAALALGGIVLGVAWVVDGARIPIYRRPADASALVPLPLGAVVASDQSWLVGWKADRDTVRFRGDPRDLDRFAAHGVDVGAVWLTAAPALRFEAALAAAGDARWRLVRRDPDGTTLWQR